MADASLRTIADVRRAIESGGSAVEACQAFLDRIDRLEGSLHAFTTVARGRALARAAALDADPGPRGPLHGVPLAIKDNLCTRGMPTTASSKILAGFVPPYDATVVERLEAAGAVIVGKTNCDEFAMGSSTENSAFGVSRNPWALDRTPGGSSGGSAVAVAAGLAAAALGSDTGGSVRQPAALCGLVGLKPTYGRVSRYGLLAFASSLDQVGPLAHTVEDAAALLAAVAGADDRDATAARLSVSDELARPARDGGGLRVGVPRHLIDQDGVDAGVRELFEAALGALVASGMTLVDVELPHAGYAIPVYYLVATAEASSNLARYDGVRYGYRTGAPRDLRDMYFRTRDEGFGAEVKRRIMLGTYVLSAGYYDAYYLKAQQVRTLIRLDYDRAFEATDVVAVPTSPTPAFPLGERVNDPLSMYLADVFTVGASLAGLPAVSVPMGRTASGLPAGLQLTGRMFDEATVLRAAAAYERETEFWREVPPLVQEAGGAS